MNNKTILTLAAGVMAWTVAGASFAYDGTKCKAPGDCWEPKPGYPDKIAGSQYDPKHDPAELNKQQESIKAMEARNKRRWEHLSQTGKFVYKVDDIK